MTGWIRWDGRTLVVAQRPNVFVYFGVFASWLVLAVALAMGGAGPLLTLLLVAMAGLMPALVVTLRVTVRAAEHVEIRTLRGRRVIAGASVAELSARRELRPVSSRYGRGEQPFVIVRLRTVGGRDEALICLDEAELDERSWDALRAGLSALAYGVERLGRR